MAELKQLHIGRNRLYLLRAADGWLMFDTALPGNLHGIQNQLARLNIDIKDIRYLVLSHHQQDHAGCAAELLAASGAKLIVHGACRQYLESGRTHLERGTLAWVRLLFRLKSAERLNYPAVKIRPGDIVLEKDDEHFLKSIGIDGIILWTPGHSEDGISLVLADGRALIGDVALRLAPRWLGNPKPFLADSMGAVFKSWNKLDRAGAKILYPGHGRDLSIDELIFVVRREG